MSSEANTSLVNKPDFSGDFSLSLKLAPPDLSRRYGFVIALTAAGKTDEIKYEVEITNLKPAQPETRIFSINRTSPVYINGFEPDLLAEQLAYEAGKVFYPLLIETNLQGGFLRVHNYADIKNRWPEKREELQDYFEGEAVEKYLLLMDNAIASQSHINRAIRNDLLISAYFSGLYRPYSQALKITDAVYLPVAGHASPAQYTVVQQVNAELNSYNAIEVSHHGNLSDDRSVSDFEQGYDFALSKIDHPELPSAQGVYDGLYVLEPDTRIIETAIINISLELTQTKNFNLKLFRIEDEKVKAAPPAIAKQQPQLLIIDGQFAGNERQANIFTKFMHSLFGK